MGLQGIHPFSRFPLLSVFPFFLHFSSLCPRTRASNRNFRKIGISLRPHLHRPHSKLPKKPGLVPRATGPESLGLCALKLSFPDSECLPILMSRPSGIGSEMWGRCLSSLFALEFQESKPYAKAFPEVLGDEMQIF